MTDAPRLPALDPASYQRHALHSDDCVWVEKNCYIDIWIELIHALGLDPMAVLPSTLAVDFEGDQWTFYKPPHTELFDLYGIDVQELTVWRPLVEHAVEHLAHGKLISSEADAFWLPDTHGTDYRTQHTKTTIIIEDIDVDAGRLGYFHNAAYYSVDGEDFQRLFRIGADPDPAFMPLFAETIRIDRAMARPRGELAQMSRALLGRYLARRPASNPIVRFEARMSADMDWIQGEGLDFYHQWAFATVRQLGAAFEMQALYLRWLSGASESNHEQAAAAFDRISVGCKALILKAARAVNRKRAFDSAELFADMIDGWQTGVDLLVADLGA